MAVGIIGIRLSVGLFWCVVGCWFVCFGVVCMFCLYGLFSFGLLFFLFWVGGGGG